MTIAVDWDVMHKTQVPLNSEKKWSHEVAQLLSLLTGIHVLTFKQFCLIFSVISR